jgi:hypothetical protein
LIKSEVIKPHFFESTEPVFFLPKYGQVSFVTISGTTGELKNTNRAFLTIIRPDGKTIESKASVLESGVYHTTLILNQDFPNGTYKITGTYNGVDIPVSYFQIKENTSRKIPVWFKNNAKWWADDKISDDDFIVGLQYLINQKIFQIEYDSETQISQKLYIDVEGISHVRRGTMQSITVSVSDGQKTIPDAIVVVKVEDYGENVIQDFEGNTDVDGNYTFSWEINENADDETLLVFVDVTDGFTSASLVYTFDVICHCGEPDCECR